MTWMWAGLILGLVLASTSACAEPEPVQTKIKALATCPTAPDGVTTYHDYVDTTYGGQVRQVKRPTGTDRNLYHFRDPWNANNTKMLGVREREVNNHSASAADVVLYDGNGCFQRVLYSLNTYSWEAVWDKNDPTIFYTRKGAKLYSYNVATNDVKLLVDMATMNDDYITVAPSLDQSGDRIGLVGKNYVWHSWKLPDMSDHRTFTPSHESWMTKSPIYQPVPKPCDSRNWRYVGWSDVVVTDCRQDANNLYGAGFYHDDGKFVLYHDHAIGHDDVGPSGKWAYFIEEQKHDVTIHLVDLSTGSDEIITTFPSGGYDNLHLSWPKKQPGWFIVGFFSPSSPVAVSTKIPYDEIYKITATNPATVTPLARLFTTEYDEATVVDGAEGYFWTQPEPSIAGDGSRINFNGNCDPKPPGEDEPVPAGNCRRAFEGDMFILFLDTTTPPDTAPEAPTDLQLQIIEAPQ